MPDIKKNSWEYLDVKTTKVPENIRNTADPKVINDYLAQHGNELSQKERDNLSHHMASLEKINSTIDNVKTQVANGTYQPVKADVLSMDDLGLYTISGISQPSFQTGGFGCWSCFYNLVLQSRGIKNLTQEDIRAYRPAKTDNEPYSLESDTEMNSDVPLNMLDMGDLALNLLPDTMIRSTEIWSYRKYKGNAPLNPEEKEKYTAAAIKAIKQQIISAIRDHGSPVGLMKDGHYITITGIEGDIISYKNSMPNPDAGDDPDFTHQKNINTLLGPALNGENADALMLNWIEDIKLSKEGNIIYNVPTPNTTVGADGKLIVNAKQSQGLFLDDRHQTGTAIGTTGGIDIADENAQYRMQLTDGFYKNEKALLPKQLNLVSLKNKAKNRSNEEEAVLTAARNKRLADQRNLEKNIADQKLNAPAFDPKWLEVQIPRFNVPIQYTGQPFFGGGNFVDFKQLLSSNGWDSNKYETLLRSLANIYNAVPGPEGSVQRQAMDALFTKFFMAEKEFPGTIRDVKNNLLEFNNLVRNGGNFTDDYGNSYRLNGAKHKHLSTAAIYSFSYINGFIKTLEKIEKKNPNLNVNSIDIDSLIDIEAHPRIDAINTDPMINPGLKAGKNYAKANYVSTLRNSRGTIPVISISPKCKYKFYDLGETPETARVKLHALDKVPNAQKDKNLVFSLVLVNAYWKLKESYDAIHLTNMDLEYLRNRYETDPDFAKTIEDIVEYGSGKELWSNKDTLTNYIYHSFNYEPHHRTQYTKEHKGSMADKIKIISKEDQQKAAKQIRFIIDVCKKSVSFMHEQEAVIKAQDQEIIDNEFNILKVDLRSGKHTYDDVAYAKKPKIDYLGVARMIVRSQENDPALIAGEDIRKQINGRNSIIDKKAIEMANDLSFVMYIQEKKDLIPAMTMNKFINGYQIFKKAGADADLKTDASFEKFDTLPELIYTADTVKASCKTYIQNISKRTQPFNRVEIMDAADLIIAKTLTAKAADTAVFKKVEVGLSNGVLDRHKLKSTIKDMRTELISSPEFLDTFSKRLSPSEFYNEYRKAINKNVNKTIKDEYTRSKAVSKTKRTDRLRINRFLKENVQEITAKQAKDIKTAYENLLEYNKGKDPSDRMDKLMKALKAVVLEMGTGNGNKQIHMDKLTKLNKYTMEYYDHRQGVFFDPITDDGKSRLSAVEKLSKVTDQISKKMAKDHPEIKPGYKAPSSPQAGR